MAASGLFNIFRVAELRKRLLFSLGMLAVYRLGIFVTTPGVDRRAMQEVVAQGGLFNLLNFFSGGAFEQLSIFALGIMPYVSASIILQLLTVVVPKLEALQKEGEMGRRKITQYTRYLTIVLAGIQGYGIATFLEAQRTSAGVMVVADPGWGFRLLTMISLAAGTAFIMWMGEQITERGIGNGISLIIFAGIVARAPAAVVTTWKQMQASGSSSLSGVGLLVLGALMVVVVGAIVFVERGQRRIPIQYAKRMVGRKLYGGQSTHLPLKVNTSGVIPPIFASSLLLFPATLAGWFPMLSTLSNEVRPGSWIYNTLYVVLIIFFAYFYTAVTFNPVDVADNLKKYGGYIPGIRPGKKTADYIDFVLSRITFGGAIYLAAICVLPTVITDKFGVSFYFGGTSLLIVVGVALDTVQQIEGHLITRHYEGFTGPRGPRIRGRRLATGTAVNA
ncbi:preprotein translocase subunit SecY [Anaeromyxobacter oryzae]|uniref:Protein translocase subunit SecY n=1 Tax=Anaeromyxobacter oryzae TaxID=2918170 RepID=A0ABN6N0K9_9BACT|nr:preprotein translocase subunit SecY [Anaeromyxobacter oryzae]BDG06752.1 protein translocase subunit SecY [Anaeromyxobacter oryzae]